MLPLWAVETEYYCHFKINGLFFFLDMACGGLDWLRECDVRLTDAEL